MGYGEQDIQLALNEATSTDGLQDSDVWGFVLGILSRGGKEKTAAAIGPVSQPAVQPFVERGNKHRSIAQLTHSVLEHNMLVVSYIIFWCTCIW